MKTRRVVRAAAINDPSDAYIKGLFGGRDWVYIRVLIHRGLEKKAFGAATLKRFLSDAVHSEDIRDELRNAIVSQRSWKRRLKGESLSPVEVDRMTHVGEVVREARRVYGGDVNAADKFLTTPHRFFEDQPPIVVAASEGGAQAVRELLARMEEGAPV